MNNPNMEGGKHYVTIFMLAAVADPDKAPAIMEPDKCEGAVVVLCCLLFCPQGHQ